MLKLSAWLAIAIAAPLGVGQLIRNWGEWDHWPFWGVDILAAVLLALAGFLALARGSVRFVAPAWGFALALYLSALLSHTYRLGNLETGPARDGVAMLAAIVGILSAVSLAGLILSLMSRSKT